MTDCSHLRFAGPRRGPVGSQPTGYIGGFVTVAREYANVELVGIESPLGSKIGLGFGWITKDAFYKFSSPR